jgi:hypothetical protein
MCGFRDTIPSNDHAPQSRSPNARGRRSRAIIPTFRLRMIVATIPQGIRICIAASAAILSTFHRNKNKRREKTIATIDFGRAVE